MNSPAAICGIQYKMVSSKKNKSAKDKGPKAKSLNSGKKYSLAPVARTRIVTALDPKMDMVPSRGDGRVRITHREYIGDVVGSVNYACSTYEVNPGLYNNFPWLSSLANNYESYIFRKLTYEFETTCATTATGAVMLAVDFDAGDTVPTSKQTILGFHNSVRSSTWAPCQMKCSVPDLTKTGQKFTRKASLAPNLDIKSYDVGNLYVATQGMAGATIVGELYVSYVVDLITPQLNTELPWENSAKIISGPATKAAPLGAGTTTTSAHDPLKVTVTDGTTLTFAEIGEYIVDWFATGTVFAGEPALTTTAALTSLGAALWNPALTTMHKSFSVKTTAPNQNVVFDYAANCATLTASAIRIAPYLYSLV